MQIPQHRVRVTIESERAQSPTDVVPVHRLPVLLVAPVGGLAGDEAYELGGAFLECFFGFFRDLGIWGEGFLHDPPYIRDREQFIVLVSHS